MSYKEPAACPACGTQKPQPRESRKSSFEKNGRDLALKCCTAVSYLRKCVKDSAQLPQGLSPVIKYIWFQSTCKKTTFQFLALFSGFCSAPHSSTERLKRKAVCKFSSWISLSQQRLSVWLIKSFRITSACCRTSTKGTRLPMLLCAGGGLQELHLLRGLCVYELLAASQATPFGLEFYGTIMETERFLPLVPFFVWDFPDARLDTTLIKKLAEIGAQKKGRFCA